MTPEGAPATPEGQDGLAVVSALPEAATGQPVPLQRRKSKGACVRCGASLAFKQQQHAKYCSDACRYRAWSEKYPRLGRVRLPKLNPTAPSERTKGLQRKCLLILARLQQGPATNVELMQIGGLRYGARLAELRAPRVTGQPGHQIVTIENRSTGITVYRLEEPKP